LFIRVALPEEEVYFKRIRVQKPLEEAIRGRK